MPTQRERLDLVRDKNGACVDRGKVIAELVESGMSQAAIADKTNLSEATISHLQKCFHNLEGKAREMCKAGRMNGDACYSLANAPDGDRARVFQCAMVIRKTKDSQRSAQHRGPKGRQTPPGQITDKDMKAAIIEVRHGAGKG